MHNQNLFKEKIAYKYTMNKWFELLMGLVLINGAVLVGWWTSSQAVTIFGKSVNFLNSAWIVFQGGIFWFVVMIGLLFIMLGISDLKE